MTETIYVELVGEGTKCWRPVRAERLSEELYRILEPKPSDENWAFQAGDKVKCKMHTFQGGGAALLAYERADRS